MMRRLSRSRLLAVLPLALLLSGQAFAANQLGGLVSKNKPVLLTADNVSYDEPGATAIATGHVEVVQGDTIVLADKVTYNQNTDMVHATGHVNVLEPTGDVFFSDDAELRNDMAKGVV